MDEEELATKLFENFIAHLKALPDANKCCLKTRVDDLEKRVGAGYYCVVCKWFYTWDEVRRDRSPQHKDNAFSVTCLKCGNTITDEDWGGV